MRCRRKIVVSGGLACQACGRDVRLAAGAQSCRRSCGRASAQPPAHVSRCQAPRPSSASGVHWKARIQQRRSLRQLGAPGHGAPGHGAPGRRGDAHAAAAAAATFNLPAAAMTCSLPSPAAMRQFPLTVPAAQSLAAAAQARKAALLLPNSIQMQRSVSKVSRVPASSYSCRPGGHRCCSPCTALRSCTRSAAFAATTPAGSAPDLRQTGRPLHHLTATAPPRTAPGVVLI